MLNTLKVYKTKNVPSFQNKEEIMAQKLENERLVNDILKAFGGKENVKNAFHCVTRLRLVPVNRDLVDLEALKQIKGNMQVV